MSIAKNKPSGGGGNRRSTYSGAGEGIENAGNATGSSSTAVATSTAKGVRWSSESPGRSSRESTTGTTFATSAVEQGGRTPSSTTKNQRRIQEKFAGVASGKEDVVRDYHFDNTPFSTKKKKKATKSGSKKKNPTSIGDGYDDSDAEASAMAVEESTINLGRDVDLVAIARGSVNVNEDNLSAMNDTSVLSLGSKSSGIASSSGGEDMDDVLACTTMSDTHELSTSNFIHNAKMRNVLTERAKELYGTAAAAAKKKKSDEEIAAAERKKSEVEDAGKKMHQQQHLVGLEDDQHVEATLTLPDLTLNLQGEVTIAAIPYPNQPYITKPGQQHQPLHPIEEPMADNDEDEASGTYIEFSSAQRRTPRKGGSHNEEATRTLNLAKLIEESSKMMTSPAGGVNLNGKEVNAEEGTDSSCDDATKQPRMGNSSIVESTASLNDLTNVLGDTTEMMVPTAESTPLASQPIISGSGSLCPSPSFLAGKKQQGTSGAAMLRKSLGGDLSEIQKLTASLRKEKRKNQSRMSLPSLAVVRQPQQVALTGPSPTAADDNNSTAVNQRPRSEEITSPPRASRKSPRKSPSRKSLATVAMAPVDSPARNTRGTTRTTMKSPSFSLPPVSPAKRMTTTTKSPTPLSPIAKDSPAKNTRANKRKGSSTTESSPARSLFNSPSDDVDIFEEINAKFNRNDEVKGTAPERKGGPFSGRKRRNSIAASNPPTKRMSTSSPESSERSETLNLEVEYPFLSISPKTPCNEIDGNSPLTATMNGTQTLAFDELMQGIENAVAKEGDEEKDDSADTAELMGMLSDAVQEESTPKATANTTTKTPKSILRSAKQQQEGGLRLRKDVGFGSPEVAEYNIDSPSVSMSQSHSEGVRERWAETMGGEDDRTTELEGDMERLIYRGNDTSILMDTIDELGGNNDVSGSSSGDGMPSECVEEETEDLETNILHLVDKSADDSEFSLPSINSVSSASSRRARKALNDSSREETSEDMLLEEPTQTVQLESTVASIVEGRSNHPAREETQTMELEGTLASMLGGDESTFEETHTMHLEGTLASLLDNRPGRRTDLDLTLPSLSSSNQNDLSEKSNNSSKESGDDTVSELGMFIAHHVSRDGAGNSNDDTISELGMNTASHTLRHEKESLAGYAQKVVDAPPEPVDLELKEVLALGDVDWERKVESQSDIFLEALSTAASPNTLTLVQDETKKVLASICEEIEAQVHDIDVDSHFRSILESNQDLMRSLQQKLRADVASDDYHNVMRQARLLLQSQNKVELVEWNTWLTQVAAVYNGMLLENVVPPLQQEIADISERSNLIDYNREKVALPMLIRSAQRVNKMNFERTKRDAASCKVEVSQLETQVEDAERQLMSLQSMHDGIQEVAKSDEKSESLCKDEEALRASADSSYYKFFSIETLHNWVVMGSSDSSICLLFQGPSVDTSIHLSFSINSLLIVSMTAKVGGLPRCANDFLSEYRHRRFHPAVSGFLKSKMDLLCSDINTSRITKPSSISSTIHCAELRVARIVGVAKELDTALGQCKSSFLQPSDTVKDGYDFTAHLSTTSRRSDRLHMILSIPDCYPFAPIGLHLHSSSSSFDTESMSRQLKKTMKPGYGALTRTVDAMQSLLK